MHRSVVTRRMLAQWSCLLWVGFLGCGGGSGVDLVPVQGTVTLDGQPLANAKVVFRPESGRPSIGKTDAAGNSTLRYTAELLGALPGRHRVSIATGEDAEGNTPKESIPARYNKETELTVDVAASGGPRWDFPLVSGTQSGR